MEFFKNRKAKKELEFAKIENELEKTRTNTFLLKTQRDLAERYTNSGYSHGGADTSKSWGKYDFESNSAKSDIEVNRKVLRERTRDLAMNAPLATAAIGATRSSVIGAGLVPKPKPDYDYLGLSKEDADLLKRQIKKEWSLWAESTLCDSCDLNNFYELQQIAFSDWLKNGEEFALVKYKETLPYMPYSLRIKLIEADRVSSPNEFNGDYNGIDTVLPDGNRIMNGVEIDSDGKVVAYYVSSAYPGEYNDIKWEWTRVKKRGDITGNPNILHIFNAERAEQYRGVPLLAPVILSLKQITRYTEAEIMAAVISSMFSLFVNTEDAEEIEFGGDDEAVMKPFEAQRNDSDIRMGNGNVIYLKPGEKIESVESKHPSGSFDSFLHAMSLQVGAALEIAPEVLLKQFNASFSASKGALNETWRSFMMRRKWFVNDFCQTVYELWFAEAVARGRINAPGFFTDPLIRKSYVAATWTGPAQGCLNPAQEAQAAINRIANGLSTHEDECAAINGSDYDENIRTLRSENEALAEVNAIFNVQVPEYDGEEDEDEDN